MLRNKHKFYELTSKEQQDRKVNDIYELINQQERNMASILQKYQDKRHYSIQEHQLKTLNTNRRSGRSLTKPRCSGSNNVSLLLPQIVKSSVQTQSRIKKHKNQHSSRYENNPYFFQSVAPQEKKRAKRMIQKAYTSDKSNKVNVRIKFDPEKIKKQQSKLAQSKVSSKAIKLKSQIQSLKNSGPVASLQQKKELPVPLSYFKHVGDEEQSSSDEGDVPLAYYEKEYRRMIRQQCLQETNFLYFSKNEQMKDWTENLLLLFEKHDKELSSLRKRCKYLNRFDNNYFSIDIFYDS